jgi:hypothetical protein
MGRGCLLEMGGGACLRWVGMRAAGCARQASIRPTLIAPSFLFASLGTGELCYGAGSEHYNSYWLASEKA